MRVGAGMRLGDTSDDVPVVGPQQQPRKYMLKEAEREINYRDRGRFRPNRRAAVTIA